MNLKSFTNEQLVGRWEDQRDLRNIMGKISYCFTLKKEKSVFGMFWSSKPDICLGINNGYYDGQEAVEGYYDAFYQRTHYTTEFIKKTFPEKMENKSDEELFGVGMMNIKPVDTAVIEIADDGETAKGVWYSRGSHVELTTSGTVSYWTFGCFAVDFVREDKTWKIWHMLYLEDLCVPCGKNWGKAKIENYPELTQFTGVEPFILPKPTTPVTLKEYYSPTRPFSPLPEPPVPYATFAETFSYGH